jgi:hypothetical protein
MWASIIAGLTLGWLAMHMIVTNWDKIKAFIT